MQHGNHGGQCIHCSVSSCKHNHTAQKRCKLNSISVCPTPRSNSGKPDESMCDSYEN